MPDQFSILALVAERLDAAGIRYMLTGSIAAGDYAQPRMTRDIDVVIEVVPADAERVAAAFTPDLAVNVDAIGAAIARQGLFNRIHLEAVTKVDVVVRKDAPYRLEEFRRRRRVELGGHPFWIVSPEDHPRDVRFREDAGAVEPSRRSSGRDRRRAARAAVRAFVRWRSRPHRT